ncbi:MAG TPA: hypothetical protein PLN69_05070 [bacterium]|nr:hypothetical protein [bacterium]
MKSNFKLKKPVVAAISFLILLSAVTALAQKQEKPDIRLNISILKEISVTENGKETVKLVEAEETSVGDILVFAIEYSNEGNAVAVEPTIVDPVPQDTVYILGSAAGENAAITFSIDGGKTYSESPITYRATTAGGDPVEVEAPAEMYSHIKWLIHETVKPGQTGELSFRVTVK